MILKRFCGKLGGQKASKNGVKQAAFFCRRRAQLLFQISPESLVASGYEEHLVDVQEPRYWNPDNAPSNASMTA